MTSRIAVFGLGYVGAVSAACFADRGHTVIGVDVNPDKVERMNAGKAPILEEGIDELTARVVESGALRATTDVEAAVAETDLALVCVGTPSNAAGGLETVYLERVMQSLGESIAKNERSYSVVVRSTCLPGTSEATLIPILEAASGRTVGDGLGYATNPEFLREASSIKDFYDPPKTVIGTKDDATADLVAELYAGLPGPVYRVPVKVAEMTKYVDNSFHALKVAFANEIGTIAAEVGIDSHQLMDVFKSDTKLNISPAYLTPGFAFGGSCLPKDVRAILHLTRHLDLETPLLGSILPSNTVQIDRAYDEIMESGARSVGIFGLSFKAGTDDLRESPLVALAERLLGRGKELMIWDEQVQTSALVGANRTFVDERIPHLHRLMNDSVTEVATHADALIVGTRTPVVLDALRTVAGSKHVLDLVRVGDPDIEKSEKYVGVGW